MPKPLPRPEPASPPTRPVLADEIPRFLLLEREVEIEYRPQILAALQRKVDAMAETTRNNAPACPRCGQPMRRQDTRPVSWLARCGCLHAFVSRYRCPSCRYDCRPLLDLLGVEPGRISGALARLLALLGRSGSLSLSGTAGLVVVGRHRQPHGRLAGGPAFGRSGGKPHQGLEPVSCRQSQRRRLYRGGCGGCGGGD